MSNHTDTSPEALAELIAILEVEADALANYNYAYDPDDYRLRAAATLKQLSAENKEIAIKLGATEEAFTDYRGQTAGKVCGFCNIRERAICYANTELLESQRDAALAELEGVNFEHLAKLAADKNSKQGRYSCDITEILKDKANAIRAMENGDSQ